MLQTTVENKRIKALKGGFPEELIEMADEAIEGVDIMKLLREGDVREL